MHCASLFFGRLKTVALISGICFMLSGCDTLKQWQSFFHSDEQSATVLRVDPTLELHIQPEKGFNAYVDNKLICIQDPCTLDPLTPGEHQLLLLAKGYAPFFLPFTSNSSQKIDLPINMVPISNNQLDVQLPESESNASPGRLSGAQNALPIALTLSTAPPQRILLNGIEATNGSLSITEPTGVLSVGPWKLKYKVYPEGPIAFTVPGQASLWYLNKEPLEENGTFILLKGKLGIQFQDKDQLNTQWIVFNQN